MGIIVTFRIIVSTEKVPLIQDQGSNATPSKVVTYGMSLVIWYGLSLEPSHDKIDGGGLS